MATPGLSKAVLQGSGPSACADHRWAWRYRRDCCLFVLLYLISLATSAPTYVPTSATTSEGLETSSTIQDVTRQYTSTIASLKEVTELPREPSKVQVLPPEPQWTTQQQYTDPPVIQRPPKNSSVVVEGPVTLRCQPTGAEPLRVRWEKDGVTLPLSGSRYNVKNNFNLKVFNASVSDRGMYRCWAENPGGSVYSSPAYLDVQVPAMIREEPQDYNVTYGTRVNLTCSVTGHPKPKLYWLRNRMRILDRSGRNPSFWEKEYYVFNATSSANYSCVVENVVTKSDGETIQEIKKSRSAVIRVNNIPNYCATYNGNQCGNYLKGRQVFIDADLYNPINKQEPLLHDILSQIDSIVREGSCRNAFRSLMCHNMLPDCDITKPAHPLPKLICREDCAVVRSELCHQDWVDLNQSRNQFFLKRFSQALGQSQCPDFPSKERSPGSCSEANLIDPPVIQRPPKNSSVVVEGPVTLRCQPTGAEPLRVRWEKDGVTLPLSGSRYNVKRNFNLKVFNASVSDRGMYRCWAENPGGSVYSSPAYLDVQVPAMIREEPQDYNVTYGTMVNLTCSVTGHPKPKLYWLRNRMRILERSGRNPSFWKKEYYVFNATSSANYSCVVENVVTKSDGETIQEIKKSRSAVIRVNNIPNYCATYNGNQCGNYLKGRQVFIDADLYNPINKQEPLLHDILSQIDSIVREGSCRNAFRSLMCHNMLPDCDITKPAHPLPKLICREDCAVVRSELCHQDWVDLNQSRNQFFLKRFSQALGQSQCPDLPSKERSPGSCSEANLIDPPVIQRPPKNSSVVVEGPVTLRCQPTGAEPLRVRWEKDGVTLPLSGSRYNVKNNFNLKVFNASVSDRGMYRCWAENPGGSVYSSPAYLDVQVPAMIREEPQDYNVTYGTRVNLTCSVTGHPKPKLYWLRNRMRILERSGRNPSFWEKEYYVFNATSSANYSCVVENVVTKSDGETIQEIKKSRSAVIRVNNIPNYCATYNGNQCGNYLKGRQVFIDADLYNPINKQEPLLHDILSQIDSIVREGSCRNAFRSLMCHNMLPDCDITKPAHPLPKLICREDCAVVRSELCHQDWVDLNQSQNQFFLKRFSQALGQSQCPDLPSKERSPGSCSEANLIVMPKDLITTDCYENQGQFYQGNISVTKTGLQCLPWTHSYPQSRNMYLSVFPELANSSNSCRNPGGMRQEPGCFPEGPYPQWQPCGVPNCADVTSTTLLPKKPTTSLPKSETSITTGRRYIHVTYPTDYNHMGDPIHKEPSNSKESRSGAR